MVSRSIYSSLKASGFRGPEVLECRDKMHTEDRTSVVLEAREIQPLSTKHVLKPCKYLNLFVYVYDATIADH